MVEAVEFLVLGHEHVRVGAEVAPQARGTGLLRTNDQEIGQSSHRPPPPSQPPQAKSGPGAIRAARTGSCWFVTRRAGRHPRDAVHRRRTTATDTRVRSENRTAPPARSRSAE